MFKPKKKNKKELRDGVLTKYHTGEKSFEDFLKGYERLLSASLLGINKRDKLLIKLVDYSDFLNDNFLRARPKDLKILINKIKETVLEVEEMLEEEYEV